MPGTSFPPSAILRNDSSALADLIDDLAGATPTTEPVAIGVVWRSSGDLVVSAGIPPAFSDHPDDITVDQGETAAFSVTASNATSYQWQKQESGVGAWANVSGATSSSYTTGTLTYADDNTDKYRCVATGPGGSTTSNSATLTVNDPVTVTLIYDDSFTIDRSAPITNITQFAASGAGNTKVYAFPNDGTGVSISGGKFNFGAVTNGWVMDAVAGRSRSAGRIHYVSFDTAASGSFQELVFGLTDDSGTLWWATSGIGPTINIKEDPGSLRSDNSQNTTNGYTWKSKINLSTAIELVICERATAGSFSLLRIAGGDWKLVAIEKLTTLAGKIAVKGGPAGIKFLNRLCTANTSFILTPLVQHSFASATTPSDGAGQTETGGSGLTATVNGSVTITGSALQMSADSAGNVVFETGATEIAVSADLTVYDSSPVGLIVRYQDASNYILVRWNSTANTMAIVEVVAGSETTLISKNSNDGSPDSYNVADGTTATHQVHIDGNLIRAWYNLASGPIHSAYVEYTTTRFASATKAGVYISKGSGVNSAKASNLVVFAQTQLVPEMTNT